MSDTQTREIQAPGTSLIFAGPGSLSYASYGYVPVTVMV
jgi:hypothetical protein